MFKTILSMTSFSPSLIGRLSDFAKELKRHTQKRRLALIFMVIATIAQIIVIIYPHPIKELSQQNSITTSYLIERRLTATNLSHGFIEASSSIAQSNDLINYTLVSTNKSSSPITTEIAINISDILEYADIYNLNNGILDDSTKNVSWGNSTIQPSEQQLNNLVVKIKNNIPVNPINDKSYDCDITNYFGNSISISINCPLVKQIESVIGFMPTIKQSISLLISIILLIITAIIYIRSYLIEKEIRIARQDISNGSI